MHFTLPRCSILVGILMAATAAFAQQKPDLFGHWVMRTSYELDGGETRTV